MRFLKTTFFYLIEIVTVLVFALSIFTTLAFLASENRIDAIRQGHITAQSQCEAVYNNHGSYSCWLSIEHHPLLFLLSIGTFFASGSLLTRIERRLFKLTKN
jgi:hypothetical protein